MLLDPRNPPDPESTTLHLLVSQVDCASGSGAKLTRACVPRTVNGTGQAWRCRFLATRAPDTLVDFHTGRDHGTGERAEIRAPRAVEA